MRVEFTTEGGIAFFPGLSRPAVIDSADLAPADAAELKRLVDDAAFFERPAPARTMPKGAADYQQYTISVDDQGRRHAIRLADPVEDPRLQALLDFLRRHSARPATLGEAEEPPKPRRSPRKGRGKSRS